MAPMSTYEIRVLRVCDDLPGGATVSMLAQRTGYSDADVQLALSILEHDGLVAGTPVGQMRTTWWRITRAGRDQLLRYPARRRIRPKRERQLSIYDSLD